MRYGKYAYKQRNRKYFFSSNHSAWNDWTSLTGLQLGHPEYCAYLLPLCGHCEEGFELSVHKKEMILRLQKVHVQIGLLGPIGSDSFAPSRLYVVLVMQLASLCLICLIVSCCLRFGCIIAAVKRLGPFGQVLYKFPLISSSSQQYSVKIAEVNG